MSYMSAIRPLSLEEIEFVSGGNVDDSNKPKVLPQDPLIGPGVTVTAERYVPPPGFVVVQSIGTIAVTHNGTTSSVSGSVSGIVAGASSTVSAQFPSVTLTQNVYPGAVVNPKTGQILPGTNIP